MNKKGGGIRPPITHLLWFAQSSWWSSKLTSFDGPPSLQKRSDLIIPSAVVAITFYPRAGTVLICDFSSGFREPEMVKARPVVVVSPHHGHYSELFTVVPLSGTAPKIVRPYHFKFAKNPMPNDKEDIWAKCDMITTVARHRLDRIKVARGKYLVVRITDEELTAIRSCLKCVIGIV